MNVLRFLADLVYPPVCARCGVGTEGVLCPACEAGMKFFGEETCRRCGAARKGRSCSECLGKTFDFSRAVAVGAYGNTFRDLVLSLKLGGREYLAKELGKRLAQRALDAALPVDAVVPVPMRTAGILRRGYNPAEILAASVATALQRPLRLWIRKTRSTMPQATLPLGKRAANPAGAYAVRKRAAVRGRSVLLVDDVLTTGGTANACARALLEKGAREVNLAVLAR